MADNNVLIEESKNVKLVSIGKTFRFKFFVPNYQRGYRWTAKQVNSLLNDLYDFYTDTSEESKEIYCLQPLVVNNNGEYWNIIDGQQRLTTLYILIDFLVKCLDKSDEKSEMYLNFKSGFESMEIRYESREESWEYLRGLNKDESSQDLYFMNKTREAIKKWEPRNNLGEWSGIDKKAFLFNLLNKVYFICYKLPKNENEIDVFKRLNIGKIGLTESELIKALFLNDNNTGDESKDKKYKKKVLAITKIANEWDQIEYRLQDDRFWMFIHENKYDRATRIDFILELVKNKKERDSEEKPETESATPVFDFYYRNYRNHDKESFDFINDYWNEIRKVYGLMCEWYNDEEIYHYVGFLSTVNYERKEKKTEDLIGELLELRANSTSRDSFVIGLKERIKSVIDKSVWDLDKEYEGVNIPKKHTRPLLLLHNVQTVIDQNACIKREKKYNLPDFIRFPFHLYRKEYWDIEHIRPNNPEDFDGPRKKKLRRKYSYVLEHSLSEDVLSASIEKSRITGCENELNKINGDKVVTISETILAYNKSYEEILKKKNNRKAADEEIKMFNALWQVVDKYGASEELGEGDKNKIWNYVLLDSSTNREYGNSCFSVKRDYIMKKENGIKPVLMVADSLTDVSKIVSLEMIEETAFVPICTQKVFSKSYTQYPDDLKWWTKKDAAFYRFDIEKHLWWYLFDQIESAIKSESKPRSNIAYDELIKKDGNTETFKRSIYDYLFIEYCDQIKINKLYDITMKIFYENLPDDKLEKMLFNFSSKV